MLKVIGKKKKKKWKPRDHKTSEADSVTIDITTKTIASVSDSFEPTVSIRGIFNLRLR
jgi:hypothetical protein